MKKVFLLFAVVSVWCACKEKVQDQNTEPTEQKVEQVKVEDNTPEEIYAPQSVNDALAEQIKIFITKQYLSEDDLRIIPEEQRKFQLYQIDLNNDGNNEVFVNFMTSYFCGTGGCTILLLNQDLKPITKFTVTQTPLWVEQAMKNGWKVVLTRSQGELKELVFANGTYPSNPSVADRAPYDAASGHAEILFDSNFSSPKTYSF
ncbi:hypothetical protein [Aestuariibaculum suncheonense]|uniref:Lipoprotein n=1 Tax=Aestuariibaculum suncheonense TaxID=1028745 RepID=A0A8J6UJ62_9FLAO|nr:hypothetical protein [Aestuariibaculum suncheonense]MBD0836969.1 hypothetical protein [Aestuariibaculum suncheonense]